MDSFSSALDLAAAIRAKKLSPVEVVDHYLARIDELNPKLNAVTWRRDADVRAEAKAAENALMRGEAKGPFFGVPMPIKDLMDVEGWPITYGSKAALDRVAAFTANIVQMYVDAGFLLLCRTNTPEFGILPVTENAAYGATRNPWDPTRSPGGSSGGAAASVASGMAPIAHANDGGGSIRIPAGCCGLVGLKPSRGRVSSGPLVSDVMHGGAVEGCVSRTVADTAAIFDQISKPDPHAWYNAPPPERPYCEEVGASSGRLRIAYTSVPPTGVPVDAACVEAVESTARLLDDLGHEVFEGAPPWPEPAEMLQYFMTVWNTGLAYWDVSNWDDVEPLTAAMRQAALQVDSISYVRAVAYMQVYSRQIVAAWGRDFDLLLTPTIAIEPPKIGALFENADLDPMMPMVHAGNMAPFTPFFNVTGQPAISLPMHWSEAGLPIGVQIVGRPWGESELIRIASQLEQARPWVDRRPVVS